MHVKQTQHSQKGEKNENATAESEHRQVLNRLIHNYCSTEDCFFTHAHVKPDATPKRLIINIGRFFYWRFVADRQFTNINSSPIFPVIRYIMCMLNKHSTHKKGEKNENE